MRRRARCGNKVGSSPLIDTDHDHEPPPTPSARSSNTCQSQFSRVVDTRSEMTSLTGGAMSNQRPPPATDAWTNVRPLHRVLVLCKVIVTSNRSILLG